MGLIVGAKVGEAQRVTKQTQAIFRGFFDKASTFY